METGNIALKAAAVALLFSVAVKTAEPMEIFILVPVVSLLWLWSPIGGEVGLSALLPIAMQPDNVPKIMMTAIEYLIPILFGLIL